MSDTGEEAGPAMPGPAGPAPDPVLAELYGSQRPPVELLPGIPLSPIVNTCCLPKAAKAMLEENWVPAPPEDAQEEAAGPPPPSFNAAAPEYNELVRRLAKTGSFQAWNAAMIRVRELEAEYANLPKGADVEAKAAEIEAAKAALADADAAVAELKASYSEDPLALVPWMQALTDLADAGLTTFEVGAQGWPYCRLQQLFGEAPGSAPQPGVYDGAERVLGTFKRRYERERGPGRVALLLKLAPNIFSDTWLPAAPGARAAGQPDPLVTSLEAFLERARANVYGPDSTEPLDLLQLVWWDFAARDPLPLLKALQAVCTDKLEVDEESGEVIVSEPRKVRGIGLVDFPPEHLKAAIQAGVPVTCVQLEHSVLVRAPAATLELCSRYGIKVLARGGTLGGLLTEKYVGAPPPDAVKGDPDLDSVPASLDMVNNMGGWGRFQEALRVLKSIADKHGVRMETVALRWQIDAGTFPLVATRWGPRVWQQFGYENWSSYEVSGGRPGVDPALFQVESFLDLGDAKALEALGVAPGM